jgi:hypothetical protein
VVVEEIQDYDILLNLLGDIHARSGQFDPNPVGMSTASKYTQGTKNLLIPPKELGTHVIFNPPQLFYEYLEANNVKDGLISFLPNNVTGVKIPIFSNLFGECAPGANFPLFLLSGLEIDITLNEHAFFVPVFDANVQDIVGATFSNSEHEYQTIIKQEMDAQKKLIQLIRQKNESSSIDKKFVAQRDKLVLGGGKTMNILQRSAGVSRETVEEKSVDCEQDCVFKCLSLALFKVDTRATDLKQGIVDWANDNILATIVSLF